MLVVLEILILIGNSGDLFGRKKKRMGRFSFALI
jgi:hypothetical protein